MRSGTGWRPRWLSCPALESKANMINSKRSIRAEYRPNTTVERVLVDRLASLLWRLRRSTKIETGLFQIEADYQRDISACAAAAAGMATLRAIIACVISGRAAGRRHFREASRLLSAGEPIWL